jgi:LPXTG-site transpeptidase (sortase) family protein
MTDFENVPDRHSLEYRLRRYGTELDFAGRPQTAVVQQTHTVTSGGLSQLHRRVRYTISAATILIGTLIISLVSFGGPTTTTIVTAGQPPTTHVTRVRLLESGIDFQNRTTMVFPVAGPSTFVDTFAAPRMSGTPFASTHDGIDIFAVAGERISSITGGTVRLRSLSVQAKADSGPMHDTWEAKSVPWRKSGTFELFGDSRLQHLQFLEVTESDGKVMVYGNVDPVVSDRQVVRAGQLLGTVPTVSGMPPHLHVARYHPGQRDPASLPFVPFQSGTELRPDNIYPLLKSLMPKPEQSNLLVPVNGIEVSSAIAARLTSLLDAAKADGFAGITGEGFRSSAAQISLRRSHCGTTDYDIYVKPSSQCKPPTARPGTSDHERGVAVDLGQKGRILTADDPFALWLSTHAPAYGFTGLVDEPWHWAVDPAFPATPMEVGSTIGTLRIESAQVNVPLLEGTGTEQMKNGAGRDRSSAPLGEAGETVLRCQRTTYGAPCFDLDLVKTGEKITVQTNNVVYEYKVNNVFVIDNILGKNRVDVPVIEVPKSLQGHAVLTVTTHTPKYSARQSLVVRAELSGVTYSNPSYFDVGTFTARGKTGPR